MDYYFIFIKIAKLDGATADAVIQRCKNIFSRQGILEGPLLKKGNEPYLVLPAYRSTPLSNGICLQNS